MRYLLTIQYVGTDFAGYQVQPALRTVEGELAASLEKTFGAPCRLVGCSRTDAGVHARQFCLTLDTDGAAIPPCRLPLAAAPFLPPDISVLHAVACAPGFHARYDVVSKEYLYRIRNSTVASPFERHRVWQLRRPIGSDGFDAMCRAAQAFIGYHDFSAFMAQGAQVRDTHRRVDCCRVRRDGLDPDILNITVSANGFLYHMVRIIVGTLVGVAYGKIAAEDIAHILSSGDRTLAGMTAPADGLYLNRVSYTDILV